MKLVTLSCPNCNAQLQINMELKQATCNFCGHQFLIDDERQRVDLNIVNPEVLGEAIEYSRRNVRGGNKELAQEIGSMIEPLCTVRELAPRANRLETLVNNGARKIENYENTYMKHLHFIASPIVFVVFFVLGLASGEGLEGGLMFGLFMGLSTLVALLVIKANTFSAYKANTASLARVTEDLNRANEELQGKDIDLIPPNYRDRESLNFIYEAIMNQRAMNVQEAINLYEDHKYKNKMQDIEQKKVQELQRLNRNVQANARKRRR